MQNTKNIIHVAILKETTSGQTTFQWLQSHLEKDKIHSSHPKYSQDDEKEY